MVQKKVKPFKHYLKNIKYPTKKDSWDIAGNLNNGFYKFDTKPVKNNFKKGNFKTKADKMVFDLDNKFIIVDIEELHTYLKKHRLKDVLLDTLISKLEWNIIINK
jgi:hypothetical protein